MRYLCTMSLKCWAGKAGNIIFALLITTYLTSAFAAEPATPAMSNPAIEAASVDSAAQFRSNLFELVDSIPLVGSMLSVIWFSVTDFKGWEGFFPILIKTLIILGSGWLGFLLLRPRTQRKKFNERAASHNDAGSIALYS